MKRRVKIDWPALESKLYELAARQIKLFAAQHPEETFCSFAFDCNSPYGDVLLSIDTDVEYRRRIRAAKAGKPFEDGPWETGAWAYVGLFPSDSPEDEEFERAWDPFMTAVEHAFEAEKGKEKGSVMYDFMDAVTRVLVRLERAGAFEPLRRTPDFRTIAIDHDEEPPEALLRIERFRRRKEPGRRRRAR